MIHRGLFQPLPFCVILWNDKSEWVLSTYQEYRTTKPERWPNAKIFESVLLYRRSKVSAYNKEQKREEIHDKISKLLWSNVFHAKLLKQWPGQWSLRAAISYVWEFTCGRYFRILNDLRWINSMFILQWRGKKKQRQEPTSNMDLTSTHWICFCGRIEQLKLDKWARTQSNSDEYPNVYLKWTYHLHTYGIGCNNWADSRLSRKGSSGRILAILL